MGSGTVHAGDTWPWAGQQPEEHTALPELVRVLSGPKHTGSALVKGF